MSEKDDVFDYVMDSPQDTNPSVLRSLLNSIPESGGAGLPDVTTDDNGDALRVVGGEWQKTDIILANYIVQAGPNSVQLVQEDSAPVFTCDALLVGSKLFYRTMIDGSTGAVTFQTIYYDSGSYTNAYKIITFTIPTNVAQYQQITWREQQINSLPNTGLSTDKGKVAVIDNNGFWTMSSNSVLNPKELSGQYVREAGNKIMLNGSEVSKDIYDAWNEGTPYRIIMTGDYEYPFEGNDQLILTPSICESGKIYYTGIYHRNGSTSYYKCVFDATDTTTGVYSTPMTDYTVNDPTTPSEE